LIVKETILLIKSIPGTNQYWASFPAQ